MNVAYNRDCVEAMKEYPDKYFDLAVVDPPYGDGLAERERERRQAVEQVRGTVRPLQDGTITFTAVAARERERERENATAKSSRLRIAEGGQSAGLVEPGRRSSEKNH